MIKGERITMKKSAALFITNLIIVGAISGCGHEHTWADATCTEPRTCTECGETEGEALGHEWVDATCTEPKTCSRCGVTEGEALGHKLSEANYQDAPVCSVCGETVGEPLEADFEKYNLTDKFVSVDEEVDCICSCSDDSSYTTTGKLTFSNYQSFPSGVPEKAGNFTINDALPEEEGYEYKVVDVTIKFYDENCEKYGVSIVDCDEDYYDIVFHDENLNWISDNYQEFSVNWHGENYEKCMCTVISEWLPGYEKSVVTYSEMALVRVPVGYDGFVLGFRNGQIERKDDQHINDIDNSDTVFFRFE
jgi:hypothetical protein